MVRGVPVQVLRLGKMPSYDSQLEVCKSKVKYSSEELATQAAKNHSTRAGRPRHKAYGCTVCWGWHLATKKD